MASSDHGRGCSLDASVRIEGPDRAGVERLLRYCARPPFALERLEQVADNQLAYRFAKPLPDGRTELRLTRLELIDRLAALVPPHACTATAITASWHATPRYGRSSPHWHASPQRPRPRPPLRHTSPLPSPARYVWALLLARIYEIFSSVITCCAHQPALKLRFPLLCPYCAGPVRIIAFPSEPASFNALLIHLGEPTAAPGAGSGLRSGVAPARPDALTPALTTNGSWPRRLGVVWSPLLKTGSEGPALNSCAALTQIIGSC